MNLKDKVVVIDNKTYHYSKIVMLATSKIQEGIVGKHEIDNSLKLLSRRNLGNKYFDTDNDSATHGIVIPQHLYFLRTDKICEGDWVYSNHRNINFPEEIFQLIGEAWETYKEFENISNIKKIIASTDPSLNLPKPSDSFLQVYIDAYNKSEKIEECLVEYDEFISNNGINLNDGYHKGIKITKGEITIRKTKDSWSREEVEELCRKALSDGAIHGMNSKSELRYSIWIEENL